MVDGGLGRRYCRADGLAVLALLVTVSACYGSALGNGLVSDDYLLFVGFVGRGLRVALSYQGSYHTIPLGFFLLWAQRSICGLDGMLHHIVSLLLFCGLGVATAWLGIRLGVSRLASWGAAFLLVTSAQVFEVPLWAMATLYSVSAILSLLSFGAYQRLVQRPGMPRQVAFTTLFVASFLTHEQALSLPLACLLWSVLVVGDRRLPALLARLLPALLAVALFTVAKVVWNDGTSVLPGASHGIVRTFGLFAYHGLRTLVPSLPTWVAWEVFRPETTLGVLAPIPVAGVAVLVALRASALERFLALWALAHVAMMAFAIGMASRHYALPLVPASLAVASLLARGCDSLGVRRSRPVFVAAISLVALLGLVQLPEKLDAWRRASQAVERILDDIGAAASMRPSATRITVVDLPDGVPLRRAEPAYIFRLGIEDAVQSRFPGRFSRFERRRTQPVASWVEPFGRIIGPKELEALMRDPAEIVLLASGPEGGLRVGTANR